MSFEGFLDSTKKHYSKYYGLWRYEGSTPGQLADFNPVYGSWGKPRSTHHVRKFTGDNLIYDVTYNFDDIGRRVTPENRKRDEFIAFFGDSMVFGEGLHENQTIPWFTQKHFEQTTCYNYGFAGHGPQQILSKLSENDLCTEIHEKKGKLIYFYLDAAVPIAAMKKSWCAPFPYYLLNSKGEIKKQDYFPQELLPKSDVYLPSAFTTQDYSLTGAILQESKRQFEKQFPGSEFTVAILPVTFSAPGIIQELEKRGIDYISLAHFDLDFHGYSYSRLFDTHFTYRSSFILSEILFRSFSDPTFKKRLNNRSSCIFTELENIENPFDNCFYQGFLFNYIEHFPRDDGLDLVIRIMGEKFEKEKLEDGYKRAEQGFKLKHKLVDKMRELGIIDYQNTFSGSPKDAEKNQVNELMSELPSWLKSVFWESSLEDAKLLEGIYEKYSIIKNPYDLTESDTHEQAIDSESRPATHKTWSTDPDDIL